jgi:membrane-associated phospholipid phosphatase
LFLLFRWAGRHRAAWFCLGAPALSLMVTEWVGKPLFHRTLRDGLAYPSGHTTAAVSVGTLLVLLGWRSGGIRRAALVAALWAVPAMSMILYLLLNRSHYPSDIVGGVGVGIGVPCLLAAAMFGRSRTPTPSSPADRDDPRKGSAERTDFSGDGNPRRRYRTAGARGRVRRFAATHRPAGRPGPAGRDRRRP